MNDVKGMIFDVQRNSFVDGPGIRTSVFFKGCNLRCVWCHNPEGYSQNEELMFYKNKCVGCGKCKEVCPNGLNSCSLCKKCVPVCTSGARMICGKEYTADELMKEIVKDKAFYASSGGGVTFSGGECMLQINFLEEVLKKCKEQRIHTAIDTAGHVPRSYFERIIPYTDMFLYDLKAFDEDVHIKYTGKPNKLILDNLVFLDSCGKDIEIRIPYVPGCNDGEMEKIANFLSQTKNVKSVKILPYHRYAESKYISLGMKSTLQDRLPTDEEINKAKELFTKYNISVY